jgi:hypothetical protein
MNAVTLDTQSAKDYLPKQVQHDSDSRIVMKGADAYEDRPKMTPQMRNPFTHGNQTANN